MPYKSLTIASQNYSFPLLHVYLRNFSFSWSYKWRETFLFPVYLRHSLLGILKSQFSSLSCALFLLCHWLLVLAGFQPVACLGLRPDYILCCLKTLFSILTERKSSCHSTSSKRKLCHWFLVNKIWPLQKENDFAKKQRKTKWKTEKMYSFIYGEKKSFPFIYIFDLNFLSKG